MEEFPSDVELTVASSLLILSCQLFSSTHNSSSISIMEEEEEFMRELQNNSDALEFGYLDPSADDTTTLCNSSITTDYSVSDHHQEVVVTDDSRFYGIKLKVVQRARTKVIYRSFGYRKTDPINLEDSDLKKGVEYEITTTKTGGSCLSSGGSSEISSAGSKTRRKRAGEAERKSRGIRGKVKARGEGPAHICRRAEAIMRFLSAGGSASEVRIRQVIGDSPDTSKALRILVKMDKVKRTGIGGRSDPFIYQVA